MISVMLLIVKMEVVQVRRYYLDNIRWFTQILVVIYHVFYMYNGEGILGGLGKITSLKTQYYDVFLYLVYPWFMSLLFIVAGISSRLYMDTHSEKEFLKSRTTKLLVPSTVSLFVFWFIQGYLSMSMSDAFQNLQGVPSIIVYMIMALSGSGPLWFLQLLWIFSIMLVPIRRIDGDRLWKLGEKANIPVIFAMTILVWGAAQILNTPVVIVYRFGLYGVMFLAGYFIFSHEEVMERMQKAFPIILVIGLGLASAFVISYFGQNYADAPINRGLLDNAFAWLGSLAMLSGFARFVDFETGFTRWMSSKSFGLYVFHYIGIAAVALFIAKPALLPAPVIYILSTIAGFGGGILLSFVFSKLPFFRWALLGIKK